jgi:hypothetical protein
MPDTALNPSLRAEAEAELTLNDRADLDPCDETERRAWVRYPCSMEAACDVRTSIHAQDQAAKDRWRATVRNLSVRGAGLLLSRRFEPKTVLSVQLEGRDRSFNRSIQMCVTHVARGPGGRWFVGGVFLGELSKDDLRRLL